MAHLPATMHVKIAGISVPSSRWLVALTRLWHYATRCEDARPILEDPSGPVQSRFTAIKKERKKLGWTINSRTLSTPLGEFRFNLAWPLFRPQLIALLKRHAWAILSDRKPKLYHGMGERGGTCKAPKEHACVPCHHIGKGVGWMPHDFRS